MSVISDLEVSLIYPNNYNPNIMLAEIFDALLEDAQRYGSGAFNPILVRPDNEGYEIIDGESRWKVVKKLGWERIKAIVMNVGLDDAKAINYRKNRERGIINPFKEAELFYDEWERGNGSLTQEEIAKKYGVSQPQIAQVLSRLKITEECREIITRVINSSNHPISSSHLELIASVENPEKQLMMVQKVVDDGLSVLQTRTLKHVILRPDFPLQKDFPPASMEEVFNCLCSRSYKINWKDKVVLPHES